MDSVFVLTLVFVFLAALIGIVVQRRTRDRCLRDFEDFRVTVTFKDAREVWGTLIVFPDDLELMYAKDQVDEQGHIETSFVVLSGQMADVQCISRHHDELSSQNQSVRLVDLNRSYQPTFSRRLLRSTRNFLNTFRDAFNQSIGIVLAQAKKAGAQPVLASQDKQIKQLGSSVLSAAANAYEPILERYVGRKVVIEEKRNDEWVEHVGVLKEYTEKWIELLDSPYVKESSLGFRSGEAVKNEEGLRFDIHGENPDAQTLTITNESKLECTLKRIEGPDHSQEINLQLGPGQSKDVLVEGLALNHDDTQAPDEHRLIVSTKRMTDFCFPRSHAVLRHGAQRFSAD
jgi:hypothetical protein